MGSTAVLVEDPPFDPAAWSIGFRTLGLTGVIDVVPAAKTVLIRCDSATALAAAVARISDVSAATSGAVSGGHQDRPLVVIPVRYDGPDLEAVAELTGCTPEEVISWHSTAAYQVAFCGFAPGFGYLRGVPSQLQLPRLSTPRTRVPAGSVAIASEFSAVYPSVSPGGWHLLGVTELDMFDPRREPPALLAPGTTVRFDPV